jgi:hypothetical protein
MRSRECGGAKQAAAEARSRLWIQSSKSQNRHGGRNRYRVGSFEITTDHNRKLCGLG